MESTATSDTAVLLCGGCNITNIDHVIAHGGNLQIVQRCRKRGASDLNGAMLHAAYGGHVDVIVRLYKNWGAACFNRAAALGGHIETVQLRDTTCQWGASDIGEVMRAAAYGGHIEIVRLCKKRGVSEFSSVQRNWRASDFGMAMAAAACHGHVRLCGVTDLNQVMLDAALGGHIEIVQLCDTTCQWGTTDFNSAIHYAARGGLMKVIQLRKKWGGANFRWATTIRDAAHGGHIQIVQWCKERGTTAFNKVMQNAARNGYIEIVQLCKEWGATEFDVAMQYAVRGGHIDIVRLCIEWGATDVNEAMINAASNGYIEIVQLCKEWGAIAFDKAIEFAEHDDHIDIVQLCKEWDVTEFNLIIRDATCRGHREIVQLCKEWGATDFNEVMQHSVRGGHVGIAQLCRELSGALVEVRGVIDQVVAAQDALDNLLVRLSISQKRVLTTFDRYLRAPVDTDLKVAEADNSAVIAEAKAIQNRYATVARDFRATRDRFKSVYGDLAVRDTDKIQLVESRLSEFKTSLARALSIQKVITMGSKVRDYMIQIMAVQDEADDNMTMVSASQEKVFATLNQNLEAITDINTIKAVLDANSVVLAKVRTIQDRYLIAADGCGAARGEFENAYRGMIAQDTHISITDDSFCAAHSIGNIDIQVIRNRFRLLEARLSKHKALMTRAASVQKVIKAIQKDITASWDAYLPTPAKISNVRAPFNTVCPICLENYLDDEPTITLSCGHMLHIGFGLCPGYLRWIAELKRTCPLCRSSSRCHSLSTPATPWLYGCLCENGVAVENNALLEDY